MSVLYIFDSCLRGLDMLRETAGSILTATSFPAMV